jgi:hypothetical protein
MKKMQTLVIQSKKNFSPENFTEKKSIPNFFLPQWSMLHFFQFEKLKSMDLGRLLSGLCRPGPSQLTTVVHGELWENNVLLVFRHLIKLSFG